MTVRHLLAALICVYCSARVSLAYVDYQMEMIGRNEEVHDDMTWVGEHRKLLQELSGKPETGYKIIEDSDGITYKILGGESNGSTKRKVKRNDKIRVIYKMYLLHNREHIYSLSNPDSPLEFIVGHSKIDVVHSYHKGFNYYQRTRHNLHIEEGFEEVVEHLHYGERARVIIPPSKGHKHIGHYHKGIPPNSYLEVYIEVLPFLEDDSKEEL